MLVSTKVQNYVSSIVENYRNKRIAKKVITGNLKMRIDYCLKNFRPSKIVLRKTPHKKYWVYLNKRKTMTVVYFSFHEYDRALNYAKVLSTYTNLPLINEEAYNQKK